MQKIKDQKLFPCISTGQDTDQHRLSDFASKFQSASSANP